MPVTSRFNGAHKLPGTVNQQIFVGGSGSDDPTPIDDTIELAVANPSAAMKLELPDAATLDGGKIVVQDISGSAATYNVTISSAGGDINGSSTHVLNANYGRVEFIALAGDWYATVLGGGSVPVLSLADLSDVNLSTPATNGQILKFDGTSSKFIPAADAT